MSKPRNGEAISPQNRPPSTQAAAQIQRVVDLAAQLEVSRGSVNCWLGWYEAGGVASLLTGKSPGAAPRLSEEQRVELTRPPQSGR